MLACREQLGIKAADTLTKTAVAIAAALEIDISSLPLMQAVDKCYSTIFGDAACVPTVVPGTIVTGTVVIDPVAMPQVHVQVVADPAVVTTARRPPRANANDLWDRHVHPNGGPRGDQNLCCISLCCAAPFAVCPLHCLATWGIWPIVDLLTSFPRFLCNWPCCPCSPNSKNPLWCAPRRAYINAHPATF